MSKQLAYCFELLILGDQRALDILMKQYGNPLRFYAFRKINDKDAAEDIVAESYCKLWYNRLKLKSASHLHSFLYMVTNNACLDYLKSHRVKNAVTDGLEDYETMASEDDILADIYYNEFLEKLIQLSKQLPKMQAEVFKLSVIEGLDTREIATILETSESTVYFSKSKALSAMRDVLRKNNLASYITYLNLIFSSYFYK